MNDWERAGQITKQVREYSKDLIKEGNLLLDIANKIENKIKELGGKPAFPVQFSINHIAAHDTPVENDERRFKKGDLIKVDIGVSINGCIGDTAYSVEINDNKNEKLIEASEKALQEAIKIIEPGIEIRKIGRVIQEVITGYGFSPIKNLSGHEIKEYEVHAGLTIPNYDNGNNKKLEKGMIIAIEPFATTGVGLIKEGKPADIFVLVNKKNVRSLEARKVISFIEEEYKTLPFASRWLKFQNINFILRLLEKEGIIKQYNQLSEKSNGLISQAEHTIEVGKGVLT